MLRSLLLWLLLKRPERPRMLRSLLLWLCSSRRLLLPAALEVLALGPGSSRRGKRRWRQWLMPPLAQFPLFVERRQVERMKPLVRVLGLVSRLLWRYRSSRCSLVWRSSLGCLPSWLLVALARLLGLMLVLVV